MGEVAVDKRLHLLQSSFLVLKLCLFRLVAISLAFELGLYLLDSCLLVLFKFDLFVDHIPYFLRRVSLKQMVKVD